MRKQVLILVSVALGSFLVGTMFSVMAIDGENPFARIWQAISDLQRRVENIEESQNGTSSADIERYINEISRVELLRASSGDGIPYYYYYGVSGHWNITKLQTEPFKEKLNSTIGGALMYCDAYDNTYYSLQPEGKGYTQLINMAVSRELSPTETEEVRLLIKSYLAHL